MKENTSPFRYGVGMLGTSLAINMFRSVATAFYVIKIGLPMEKLALIAFLYTFIDALDNPVYGYLSDNTRSKWGRRKPWLVISTPLFVLFFILFYSPPATLTANPDGTGLFLWALLMYTITGTLDSMINANYGALFPELFPAEEQRAKTNGIRQIFQLIAMVVGIALTPMITSAIGYTYTAIAYGVISLIIILYMTVGIKEPPITEDTEKVAIGHALLSMIKSKNFWIVGLTNAFYSATMALVIASVPFFILYALQIPESQGTYVLGTVILIAILGVAVWSSLIKKLTAVKTLRIALIILTCSFIPLYFTNSLLTAILASVVVGIGLSGVISTMDVVCAKVMDEDYLKYGIKRQGIYSSTLGFMNRMSGLFVSLALLLAARIYNFKSGDEPGERPGDAAKFMLTIFPFFLSVLSIAFSFLIKFSENNVSKLLEVNGTNES